MTKQGFKKLLLIGMDNAALSRSANRAGYKVYSVGYFGDLDIRNESDDYFAIIDQHKGRSCGFVNENFDPEKLLIGAKELSRRNPIDAILLSTGLDDSLDVLSALNKIAPILGNSPQKIQRVRDKPEFLHELRRLKVPFPETAIIQDISEGLKAANNIGYPILVKPINSFSGFYIKKIMRKEELKNLLKNFFLFQQRAVIQKFIKGIAASASVISSTSKSITLTVNEQLYGLSSFGQIEPFGYCGNLVPLNASEKVLSSCRELACKIITHFKLVGSNGVDFMISQDGIPHIVEVNPRFQGTLECVEILLDLNLLEAHIKACIEGVLPEVNRLNFGYCIRLVLYALQRAIIPDLKRYSEVRDVPPYGMLVEKGEPVCSIISEGRDRETTLRKASDLAKRIIHTMKPV